MQVTGTNNSHMIFDKKADTIAELSSAQKDKAREVLAGVAKKNSIEDQINAYQAGMKSAEELNEVSNNEYTQNKFPEDYLDFSKDLMRSNNLQTIIETYEPKKENTEEKPMDNPVTIQPIMKEIHTNVEKFNDFKTKNMTQQNIQTYMKNSLFI